MSKLRGYRSAEMPSDPARLLRALRACREAMLAAEREVRIGGALYVAGHALRTAIDAVAKHLTGNATYFLIGSSSATDGERAHSEKWKRIEAGEEPWPK